VNHLRTIDSFGALHIGAPQGYKRHRDGWSGMRWNTWAGGTGFLPVKQQYERRVAEKET
jgi:hypothetical protein